MPAELPLADVALRLHLKRTRDRLGVCDGGRRFVPIGRRLALPCGQRRDPTQRRRPLQHADARVQRARLLVGWHGGAVEQRAHGLFVADRPSATRQDADDERCVRVIEQPAGPFSAGPLDQPQLTQAHERVGRCVDHQRVAVGSGRPMHQGDPVGLRRQVDAQRPRRNLLDHMRHGGVGIRRLEEAGHSLFAPRRADSVELDDERGIEHRCQVDERRRRPRQRLGFRLRARRVVVTCACAQQRKHHCEGCDESMERHRASSRLFRTDPVWCASAHASTHSMRMMLTPDDAQTARFGPQF